MPPNGCAMIPFSPGYRAEFYLVLRESWRSTPMTAADRSTRSLRALLFLIVSFGLPILAAAATLEDSAKEFAQKIAAALPGRENVFYEIRNVSSLQPDEVSQVEKKLTAELQDHGNLVSGSGAAISVVVTLSENVKGFVWTAEIRQGDAFHTVLLFVTRLAAAPKSEDEFPLRLASERFWIGPERALDANTISAPNGDQLVVFLLPETVVIQDASKNIENRIHISLDLDKLVLREPGGTISQTGNFVEILIGRRDCTISLETYELNECRDSGKMGSGGDVPLGGQVVLAMSKCTKLTTWFVTGTGDDTQPDSLRIVGGTDGSTLSNQLNFSGPIVAIHGNSSGTPARAIVRNLQTGNYDAYYLYLSCAGESVP